MNKKGFSIIEVLIAFVIITVGMLAVLTLFSQNIQARVYTKNKLIASMLAQEGIELVRSIRDSNWADTAKVWDIGSGAGNPDDILQDGHYTLDYLTGTDATANSLNDPLTQLYINANGFYDHTITATPTQFYRLIEVFSYSLDGDATFESIKLTSTVRWEQGGHSHDYEITTMLLNWK